MPQSTARLLPTGVFYILAGPDDLSYNLWQVSANTQPIELTDNRASYGISSLGASSAGIVVADAQSGFDELGRITKQGFAALPEGHASDPVIDDAGEVAYVTAPASQADAFSLSVASGWMRKPRVLLHDTQALIAVGWTADGVLVISNPHQPGDGSGAIRVLQVGDDGHARPLPVALPELSNVVCSTATLVIAVSSWSGQSELVWTTTGRTSPLPAGWVPKALSPSGQQLLLFKAHSDGTSELGLVSVGSPGHVEPIGPLTRGTVIGSVAWLSSVAST
jgi:hypothetical protein